MAVDISHVASRKSRRVGGLSSMAVDISHIASRKNRLLGDRAMRHSFPYVRFDDVLHEWFLLPGHVEMCSLAAVRRFDALEIIRGLLERFETADACSTPTPLLPSCLRPTTSRAEWPQKVIYGLPRFD